MPCSPEHGGPSRTEDAVTFACDGQALVGILHGAAGSSRTGVLIVTGGPQYRIGSHRQFLLLARAFAAAGFPTLRFDHRGSGDSEGTFPGFERIGPDIEAAVTALVERVPDLDRVVLWGLCDAASAILLYAPGDPRVAGLVLLNPWVRTEDDDTAVLLKHYYGRRLLTGAFWRKLFAGEVAFGDAWRGLRASLAGFWRAKTARADTEQADADQPLPQRMARGLAAFSGPAAIVLSGRDLTARAFEEAAADPAWRTLLAADRVQRFDLPKADHTFSRRVWRDEVSAATIEWLRNLES